MDMLVLGRIGDYINFCLTESRDIEYDRLQTSPEWFEKQYQGRAGEATEEWSGEHIGRVNMILGGVRVEIRGETFYKEEGGKIGRFFWVTSKDDKYKFQTHVMYLFP